MVNVLKFVLTKILLVISSRKVLNKRLMGFLPENFTKVGGAFYLLELISSPFCQPKFPHTVNQFHMLTSYSTILIFFAYTLI